MQAETTDGGINKTETKTLVSPTDQEAIEIRELEKQIFDWEVSEEILDRLIDKIKNEENITAVVRNNEQNIVGYMLGIPSTHLDAEILAEDPSLRGSSTKIYIETLAIAEQYRGALEQIRGLLNTFNKEARERGYETVAGHVPTEHYALYERFYNAQILRTINDWFGTGKDHYYIEYNLK